MANQRIVVRSLDVPLVHGREALDAVVRARRPDHIPMPMDEAVLDFQSLGEVETPEGPRMRVLVVAVRREMVERLSRRAATTPASSSRASTCPRSRWSARCRAGAITGGRCSSASPA